MVIYLSLLVCLIGLVVYILASNPKAAKLGELAYFAGLLAFLLQVTGAHFGVLTK